MFSMVSRFMLTIQTKEEGMTFKARKDQRCTKKLAVHIFKPIRTGSNALYKIKAIAIVVSNLTPPLQGKSLEADQRIPEERRKTPRRKESFPRKAHSHPFAFPFPFPLPALVPLFFFVCVCRTRNVQICTHIVFGCRCFYGFDKPVVESN